MKSNFILVGTIKKKNYSITIDRDKTLDKLDFNSFKDQFEKAIRDRAAAIQYSAQEVGRAFRMAIDAHVPPLREAINNVEDEVLTIRQAEIDQLIDVRDI